ncbi:MAG: hypothetical protein HY746_10550 [Elusimicrobia bacterium]|nr:hypothetical protein [Elusimicrobiota bacterium]
MNTKIFCCLSLFLLLSGCASFNSGDVVMSRPVLWEMLEDKTITPFSKINTTWINYPYKSSTDFIGEGSVMGGKKIKPVRVKAEDRKYLQEKVQDIFAEAGLYDAEKGTGTLNISLTSFGRWRYREIFSNFLTETPFIMIFPATLQVNYYLVAESSETAKALKIEETAHNKTVFHVLIFPLYPLFSPAAKERSLLKNMLWKTAADIYTATKKQ